MIYIKVSENGMLHTFDCTVSDSVRYETVKFDFPKSWDGYTKTAVFRNGDNTLSVILNSDSDLCVGADECYIPHEVIKAPEFTVSVFGVSGDSRVTASQAAIRVIQSGYGKGGEPSDPTPSEYEQLITLANETKEIAQSVRTDADNGVFKGAPFTYSDFTDEQLAALKGKDGADGKDGTNGTDGKDGKDGYTPQKGVDYFTPEDIAGLNIPSVDQTYSSNSENAQSGKAVAEAVAAEQKRIDNISSNAIKGAVSDSQVLLYDVSPIVHDMTVRVSSESISDLSTVKVIKKNGSGEIISEHTPNADGTVKGVTSFAPNEVDIWDGTVATEFAGGDGTEVNPYRISNAEQFALLGKQTVDNLTSGAYYKLTSDIVLNDTTNEDWKNNNPEQWSYGAVNASFQGTLDGDGCVIKGLYINSGVVRYMGLFSQLADNATIKNLGIEDSYINNTYIRPSDSAQTGDSGAFAGVVQNRSSTNVIIENCYVADTVTVISNEYAGGFIGDGTVAAGRKVNIKNCYSSASLTSTRGQSKGAFVAFYYATHAGLNLKNCYSTQSGIQLVNGYWWPQLQSPSTEFDGLFENCYSLQNQTFTSKDSDGNEVPNKTFSGLTVLAAADMLGENAKINMTRLDWDNVWRIEDDEFPKLRNFSYGAVLQLVTDTNGIQIYCEYNKDIKVIVDSKENISNKTTSLTSSSKNEEYPTAKAVYDFVNQAAASERSYADSTFATITAFNTLKSIVDGKKVIYRQYAQNEQLIVEKSKVYIVKAFPADSAINLWVTDSSDTVTKAYAEDGDLFPDCSVGILISPDTDKYNGIYFIEITGKLSITNLNPFHDARFANWKHSDIKNLALKSTASDGMAVWTIEL